MNQQDQDLQRIRDRFWNGDERWKAENLRTSGEVDFTEAAWAARRVLLSLRGQLAITPLPPAEPLHVVERRMLRSPNALLKAVSRPGGRDDPTLPAFITAELARDDVGRSPEWRDALLVAAGRVQVRDLALRKRLAGLLLAQARAIRPAPGRSERALWAALARYATLIEETEDNVSALLDFLRPSELEAATVDAALQALFRVFSRRPPSSPLRDVKACVAAIAREEMAGPRGALALSAYLAVLALRAGDAEALTERAIALGKPWFLRQALSTLEPLHQAWRETAPADAEVIGAVVDRFRATLVPAK